MEIVSRAIAVVTLFPEMVQMVGQFGVTGRAIDNGLVHLATVDPRANTVDRHRTVDDRPYGGGPGMVLQVGPLSKAIESAKGLNADLSKDAPVVVYVSPQGETLNNEMIVELGNCTNLILVAGRYEGVDERVISSLVDREISIGDYVLSGGELAAMVIVDALSRQLPGALGHEDSASQDSFSGDGLLDCPHYTRPEEFNGLKVPSVLLSGDHKAIAKWRRQQSLGRTWQRRPELLRELELSADDQQLLEQYKDTR